MDADVLGFAAAALTAFVGFSIHVVQERSKRRAELRKQFADALTDVFHWAEVPYRIRRRGEGGRPALVEMMHGIQERLLDHDAWLRVEAPSVHDAYTRLVDATKRGARPLISDAWAAPPLLEDVQMNMGDGGTVDVRQEVSVYLSCVREHLSGYQYKFWR